MNDLEVFIDWLHENKNNIFIYGSGEAARLTCVCVERCLGFHVSGFVDRLEGICCGENVLIIDQLKCTNGIIIAANPEYMIEERLKKRGFTNYIYIDPVFLNYYCHIDSYIEKNRNILTDESVKKVAELLEDSLSVEIYTEMCLQRVYPCMKKITQYYDREQYFGNDVIKNVSGGIVDCGAYDGDTLRRFLRQVGDCEYKYHALEADSENCMKIRTFIENNKLEKNVFIYNIAAWNKKAMIDMANGTDSFEKTSGYVLESSNNGIGMVEANKIDSIINKNINLITMDIEGAEIEALQGAEKTIRKYAPKLAISIYHKTEHLIQIPLLLHQINPGYKLYVRHHRWNIADTICYAI